MQAAEKNLHVSEELLADLAARADAEGRTVDEVAEESLRKVLRDRSWQDLLARGKAHGAASGIAEEQVPQVLHEWRKQQPGH